MVQKKKIKKHEKVCNDHDYCYVEMSNEDNKILRHNHRYNHLLFMLTWSVCLKICTHLKIILKNPIQKKTMHKASAYSMFSHCSFD